MAATKRPAGGVAAVELLPCDGAPQPAIELVEGRSSYTEECLCDGGAVRVRHTLTLVVPRTTAAALVPLAEGLALSGATAVVTTGAGERLTVGWSERFGREQPLRLRSFVLATGERASAGNAAVLRFESEDRSALCES